MTGHPGISPEERTALAVTAEILNTLPDVLAAERERRGLSQEAAAEQMGVDRQSVNRLERSRTCPFQPELVAVLRWLAVP